MQDFHQIPLARRFAGDLPMRSRMRPLVLAGIVSALGAASGHAQSNESTQPQVTQAVTVVAQREPVITVLAPREKSSGPADAQASGARGHRQGGGRGWRRPRGCACRRGARKHQRAAFRQARRPGGCHSKDSRTAATRPRALRRSRRVRTAIRSTQTKPRRARTPCTSPDPDATDRPAPVRERANRDGRVLGITDGTMAAGAPRRPASAVHGRSAL